MNEITEGEIKVLIPSESIEQPTKTSAFYNPRMRLNRDFSIAAARAFFKGSSDLIKVCEPLSASGIRALRYAKEVRNTNVICSDIKETAFKIINKNIDLNGLRNIRAFNEDANKTLERADYDLIDLDPFGTAEPFLETAIKQINIGGLLGITATDMTALCGVYPEAAKKRYGGKTLRTDYCYELGARVLIYAAARIAEKYKKSIEPLLVLGIDHYIRIFLKMKPKTKNQQPKTNTGYIYHCFDCGNRKVSKTEQGQVCDCGHKAKVFAGVGNNTNNSNWNKPSLCGKTMEEAGPLWIGPIYNNDFLRKVKSEIINSDFNEKHRALKLIDLMIEEAKYPELVTFYDIHKFCKIHNLVVPKTSFVIEKLKENGFKVSRTHFSTTGIRTNAQTTQLQKLIKGEA